MSGNLQPNQKALGKRGFPAGLSIEEKIKQIATEHQASSCAIAEIQLPSETLNRFDSATQNLPLNLSYILKGYAKRKDIRNWFPEAKSVLICSFQYWNLNFNENQCILKPDECKNFLKRMGRKFHEELLEYSQNRRMKISRYAMGFDYHKVLKKILKDILENIKTEFSQVSGKIFVDTSPVMEKEFARISGLGWQGKNTLIVSKMQGSYFFLGGIALSIKLKPDKPIKNECNGCRVCIDACPTKALRDPGILDPNLCISYWTTQHKQKIGYKIARMLDGWVYGCDLCQQVCPYNKNISVQVLKELTPIKKQSIGEMV